MTPNDMTPNFIERLDFIHSVLKSSAVDFQTLSGRLFNDTSPDSGLGHSRERAHSGSDTFETGEMELKESSDLQAIRSLLSDCGASSVSHLR